MPLVIPNTPVKSLVLCQAGPMSLPTSRCKWKRQSHFGTLFATTNARHGARLKSWPKRWVMSCSLKATITVLGIIGLNFAPNDQTKRLAGHHTRQASQPTNDHEAINDHRRTFTPARSRQQAQTWPAASRAPAQPGPGQWRGPRAARAHRRAAGHHAGPGHRARRPRGRRLALRGSERAQNASKPQIINPRFQKFPPNPPPILKRPATTGGPFLCGQVMSYFRHGLSEATGAA